MSSSSPWVLRRVAACSAHGRQLRCPAHSWAWAGSATQTTWGAVFDKGRALVLGMHTTEAVRQLIRREGNTLCMFEREGGVYVLDGHIEDESEQGFTRQGR